MIEVTTTVTYTSIETTRDNVDECIALFNDFAASHGLDWVMEPVVHASLLAVLKPTNGNAGRYGRHFVTSHSPIVMGTDGSVFFKGSALAAPSAVRTLTRPTIHA